MSQSTRSDIGLTIPPDSDSVKNEVEEKVFEVNPADVHPDGGLRAWLNVLGTGLVTFMLFGLVNSWGVFQSYYQTNTLRDRSPSDIAWIGSLQYSLLFLPCLLWGRLFDIGYFKSVVLVCYVMMVLAIFLVAYCTEYWHFLLCQGIAIGLSGSGMLAPAPLLIAQWFKKRRGLALCIYATGSSIGGTALPIMTRLLIPKVGFHWTMRILALIALVSLGVANLLLRRRIPAVKFPKDTPLFNLDAFKSGPYSAYCAATLFTFLGIYTVLTYTDIGAVSHGIHPDFAFYLVAIANASSGVGRYCAGLLADSAGSLNVMMPFTLACGILTYAWPYAQSKEALIVVAVLYGFATGSFLGLTPNPIIDLGHPSDVGKNVGMMMSIMAIGALIGPPISGAINSATGGFEAMGFFAGSAVVVGVGLMLFGKYLTLGSVIGKL